MLSNAASAPSQTLEGREERIQALIGQLRPAAEQTLRHMAEQLVDLPDERAFGAIELTLRDAAHDLAAAAHQAGLQAGKKKGYRGSSIVCPHCRHDARFINYLPKTLTTTNGLVRVCRAYYHCPACAAGSFPFDADARLEADRLSPGLRPLVCLAGTLASFQDAADDLLRRFAGVRLSASTALRATETAGDRLGLLEQAGHIVHPSGPTVPWDFTVEGHAGTVAYLGLDAFSVPIQLPGGGKSEHRMLYVGLLYTPDKKQTRYLVDFELNRLAGQLRQAAIVCGLGRAERVIALSDGGNGLEEALRRHFWDDLLCILDWYHAAEHLHAYAKCLHGGDAAAAAAWARQAKGVLYEQGGTALLTFLGDLSPPATETVAEELRKLIGYFTDNEHRTNYPYYRSQGWDIGSGPTEAGCKIVGARLKGSGMRWIPAGAAKVAPLRALYESGPEVWDAFWALKAA